MQIKIINDETYEKFVLKSDLKSLYQSLEWKCLKENENKKCELLGLYEQKKLIGVSLVVYVKILKKFYMAYASRGFVYDYMNVKEFKKALIDYFKNKKVIFFRMDPPIILATYNKDLIKTEYSNSQKIINDLKDNGFKHFGFNMAYETTQFRFIHRLKLTNDFESLIPDMSKSTKKNMDIAKFKGVRIKETSSLEDALHFINLTEERKSFHGLSKKFYLNLMHAFADNLKMYIVYIDKNTYITNLKNVLDNLESELKTLNDKKNHINVGRKLKNQENILKNQQAKYQQELKEAQDFAENVAIGSIITIEKYDELVAFASGMDNLYRHFNPKYVMYPEIIKKAIKDKKQYVNFLGVKNIMDKNDKDYGIYEIKKGFGGETVEYIGEFDLPIDKYRYSLYKIITKIK